MKENNILNLLAAILTSTSAPEQPAAAELNTKDNKPSSLVENLRRQLMKDNYDYMTDESTTLAIEHKNIQYHKEVFGNHAVEQTKLLKDNHHTYKRTTIDIPRKFDKQYVRSDNNRTHGVNSLPDGVRRNPAKFHSNSKYLVSIENRKKLATAGTEKAIYVYDDINSRRRHSSIFVSKETNHAGAEPEQFRDQKLDDNTTAENQTVRYSVVKVKAGGRRRAPLAPHLVKEEKEHEVSIVNLGEGPLPEFRLPGARRQYMRDGELSDAPLDLE